MNPDRIAPVIPGFLLWVKSECDTQGLRGVHVDHESDQFVVHYHGKSIGVSYEGLNSLMDENDYDAIRRTAIEVIRDLKEAGSINGL